MKRLDAQPCVPCDRRAQHDGQPIELAEHGAPVVNACIFVPVEAAELMQQRISIDSQAVIEQGLVAPRSRRRLRAGTATGLQEGGRG